METTFAQPLRYYHVKITFCSYDGGTSPARDQEGASWRDVRNSTVEYSYTARQERIRKRVNGYSFPGMLARDVLPLRPFARPGVDADGVAGV